MMQIQIFNEVNERHVLHHMDPQNSQGLFDVQFYSRGIKVEFTAFRLCRNAGSVIILVIRLKKSHPF